MKRLEDGDSFEGVIKGGNVVLDGAVSLPDGTPVVVTVRSAVAGSPQAVLAAMAQAPRLGEDDVAALLQEIERGRRPVRFGSPLD